MFTGEGFSLNLGFRKFLCSQTMDSVLFQVSQKYCVHQRILYLGLKFSSGFISTNWTKTVFLFVSIIIVSWKRKTQFWIIQIPGSKRNSCFYLIFFFSKQGSVQQGQFQSKYPEYIYLSKKGHGRNNGTYPCFFRYSNSL